MFDAQTTAFLESGCALIVGTTTPDGEPFATRGWGLTMLCDGDTPHVRVLLDSDDAPWVDVSRMNGAVAITATNVPTLRSMQLKGQIIDVEKADDEDRARAQRFCRDFFDDIVNTERTPRALIERIEPEDFIACVVRIEECFDQTPGPGAGSAISS